MVELYLLCNTRNEMVLYFLFYFLFLVSLLSCRAWVVYVCVYLFFKAKLRYFVIVIIVFVARVQCGLVECV